MAPFYQKERLGPKKVARLHRFLESKLAQELWNMTPEEVAGDLPTIWLRLANTMRQKPDRKTIAFAPKTIGNALRILGIDIFNYEGIPIPVDSRIKSLTPYLDEKAVQKFWAEVLKNLRSSEPRVSMYHLDGFLWNYAGADNPLTWLNSIGVGTDLGRRIVSAFQTIVEVKPP